MVEQKAAAISRSPRLLDALKQYVGDAAPGGALNQEWTPDNVRTAAEVGSMEPGVVGSALSAGLAVDDVRKGNYGDAALNAVGVLPFVPALGGTVKSITKPLSESQFYRQYAQHIDIRGKHSGNAKETAEKVAKEGFKSGVGVNALPPSKGGKPLTIIDEKFAPKVGDYVYLAPKNAWKNTPSGMKIQSGWKPGPGELLVIKEGDVGKSTYQLYLEALAK